MKHFWKIIVYCCVLFVVPLPVTVGAEKARKREPNSKSVVSDDFQKNKPLTDT